MTRPHRKREKLSDVALKAWVTKIHGEAYANLPAHDGHVLSQGGYKKGCARCRWLSRAGKVKP